MCNYIFFIETPEVCNHPSFENFMNDEQLWILELVEIINPNNLNVSSYRCTAQHNGYGKIDSFYFQNFSLYFESDLNIIISNYKAR